MKLLPTLVVLFYTTCLSLIAAPPTGQWALTFEDEFDGDTLDGGNWKIAGHWGGINGQGSNGKDNIEVDNGMLRLIATDGPSVWSGKTYDYGGAELTTFRRFKQRYGYFEARLRWPAIRGLWPAFWTMPDRANYGNPYRHNRAFLKFDLTGEPLGTINSATLRLTIASFDPATLAKGASRHVMLFRMADDSWSEATVTWNNQPTWDPLYLEQFHGEIGTPGETLEIDVTEYIQAAYAEDGVCSFALADTIMLAQTTAFHSREATNAAVRPQLVINGVAHEATEDAYVNLGNPNSKNGLSPELLVGDYWGNTAITSHGGMEIDIMEALGVWGQSRFSHVLHWDGYVNGISVESAGWGSYVDDTSEFHTYGVYWEPGLIEFYTDGELTGTFRDSRVPDVEAYLLLSMQIGGWDGNGDVSPAIDGAALEVDWVRVWSGTRDTRARDFTAMDEEGQIAFGSDLGSYGSQGMQGFNEPSLNGETLYVTGNSWVRVPLVYQVGPDTILEFDFDAGDLGEILGIGLDENNNESDSMRIFQLGGSQVWANAIQDYNTFSNGDGLAKVTIPIGEYYTGAITCLGIVADDDRSPSVDVSFSNVRIRESSGSNKQSVSIGALGRGVTGTDWRGGTGYLMYSAQDTFSRFNAFSGSANHVIAVYFSGGQWYADRNYGQIAFQPAETDVLLAAIDFSADTTTSLQGESGNFEGIHYGYLNGDLTYQANVWNGGGDNPVGEFGVSGSGFTPNPRVPLPLPSGTYDVTPLNDGIAASPNRYNFGYLMYSSEDVNTRFNVSSGNANHFAAVFCYEGKWFYDSGSTAIAFTPTTTDILVASVQFRDGVVTLFESDLGYEQGMRKGYLSGDLAFTADQWANLPADGPFAVAGSTFLRRQHTAQELYNEWRVKLDWSGTPPSARIQEEDPDADGRSNFLEFAYGSDPSASDTLPPSQWSLETAPGGAQIHVFEYPKPLDQIEYQLQYSFDLITWQESGLSAEMPGTIEGMAMQHLNADDSLPQVFFRMHFPGINLAETVE